MDKISSNYKHIKLSLYYIAAIELISTLLDLDLTQTDKIQLKIAIAILPIFWYFVFMKYLPKYR